MIFKKAIIVIIIFLSLNIINANTLKIVVKDRSHNLPISNVMVKISLKYVKFRNNNSFKTLHFEGKTNKNGCFKTTIDDLLNNEVVLSGILIKENFESLKIKDRFKKSTDTLKCDYVLSSIDFIHKSRIVKEQYFDKKIKYYLKKNKTLYVLTGISLGSGDKSEPYNKPFLLGGGLKVGLHYYQNISSSYNIGIGYEFDAIDKSELFSSSDLTKRNSLRIIFNKRINENFKLLNFYLGTHLGVSKSVTDWENKSWFEDIDNKGRDTAFNIITGLDSSFDYFVTKNFKIKIDLICNYNIPVTSKREQEGTFSADQYFNYKSGINTNININFGWCF